MMDSTPLFDEKRLNTLRGAMEMCEFNDIVCEVATLAETELHALREAVKADDLARCHILAHEMKGVFGNVGALRAAALACDIQRAKGCEGVASLITEFEAAVEATLPTLQRAWLKAA
jgi:hypothetical protein